MNEKAKTENEAEVIMPDRDLVINGENVTVNEFRFRQGMIAETIAAGIITDIASFAEKEDQEISLSDISGIFEKHWDAFIQLLSMSTGKDIQWFDELSDDEGMTLTHTFWVVNSSFFMKRLMAAVMTRKIPSEVASISENSFQH